MKFNINKTKSIRRIFNWKEKIKNPDGIILKLYHHGLVGQCLIKDNCICSLVVNPSFRKKGYGKKILKKAEQIIGNKFDNAMLVPQDNNEKLRGYYSKLGYIGFDPSEPGYEEEDKFWWTMKKKLK